MASSAQTINERVIRWSEMRLPHPSRPGSLATWELDGPFAVRPYYRVEGEEAIVRIDHLDQRRDDGTLAGCRYCGAGGLSRRAQAMLAFLSRQPDRVTACNHIIKHVGVG